MAEPDPLRIQNLHKSYGSTIAVDDVSLRVERGEMVGLLGPNGAGKTTTTRVALGFLKPDKGELRVFDEEVTLSEYGYRRKIGYLPGEVRLPSQATGRDVLEFLGRCQGGDSSKEREQLSERFGFDPSKKVRAYSKGNRQKLGLIASLQAKAPLLILDEPTSGLDPLVQQCLLTVLKERAAEGTGVLFSSHVLSEVQAVCDRVIVMRSGELVYESSVEELGLGRRRVELVLSPASSLARLESINGVSRIEVDGSRVRFQFDAEPNALVEMLASMTLSDLVIERPELEDLFLSLYEDQEGGVS